jgi:hypothetical protein
LDAQAFKDHDSQLIVGEKFEAPGGFGMPFIESAQPHAGASKRLLIRWASV